MLNTHLEKIITSPVFAKSKRQRELLTYLVQQMNAGNGPRVKGYVIALDVFKRNENFDPSLDAIVRVEVGRLRHKLREYYQSIGLNDLIEISLPKGTYCIQIINREINKDSQDQALTGVFNRVSTPKIAVMPFKMIDSDDCFQELAPEIADYIIFELVDSDSIYLISRQISFSYNQSSSLPSQIAGLLGAQYLIEGSYHVAEDLISLRVRVFNHLKNSYIWQERFSFKIEDKNEGFRTIAACIYKFLIDDISPIDADAFDLKQTNSPVAQQLVIKGMESFWKYSPKHIRLAKKYFQDALNFDFNYSSAGAWLARTLIYEHIANFNDQTTSLDCAQQLSEKACQDNPNSSFALAVLGWLHLWKKNQALSIEFARKAVLIDPENSEALSFLSMILTSNGYCKEGLIFANRVHELNLYPTHVNKFSLGFALFGLARYQEAKEMFEIGCNMNETFLPNYVYRALSKVAIGEMDKIEPIREKILCVLGGNINKLSISYFVDENLKAIDLNLREEAGLSLVCNRWRNQ